LTRLLGLSLLLVLLLRARLVVLSRLMLAFRSALLLRLSLRSRLVLSWRLALLRGAFLCGSCSVRAWLSLPFAPSAAPSALVVGVALLRCTLRRGICCRLRLALLSLLLLHRSLLLRLLRGSLLLRRLSG
jgi:hypothetical protein